ncbi:MAG: hypothetical protein AB1390_12260, partial [Nitrospirota bacterium]
CRRAYSETKMTVTCKEKHFSILVAAYLLKSQLEKSYFSNPFISLLPCLITSENINICNLGLDEIGKRER